MGSKLFYNSTMIVTITPNPAIDRTLTMPRLEVGGIHRATRSLIAAGGKGLNVARAIRQVGGYGLAMGLVGGHSGRWLAQLAAREGIPTAWTWIAGESRTCTMVVSEGNDATVFNENGPTVTAAEWETLIADVLTQTPPDAVIALCGSLPPGVPSSAPADLIMTVQATGRRVWVDGSGNALRTALTAMPYGIKINRHEAAETTQMPVTTPADALQVAIALRERGISQVVITLGAEGAILVNPQGVYHALPPTVEIVSTVGSGDAFLGGLLLALERGNAPVVALRHAVATGTANAMRVGGGMVDLEGIGQLLEQVSVTLHSA